MKKVLIATGGTGGHIFPALVTAQELRRRGLDVVFAGVLGPAGDTVRSAGFAAVDIAPRGFVSKGLLQKALAVAAMGRALVQCVGVVRRTAPDVILGFGGYSSFPVVLAGVLCGVRAMIHEQNAVPGAANRLLAGLVWRIAVGFRDAVAFFPAGKTIWTGNPLRYFDLAVTREQACAELGIDPGRRTVLVFGGSQGSRALNREVVEAFASVPAGLDVQVIHVTGRHDLSRVKDRYQELKVPALVREYMDPIALAYAAADLVVARSGAGTVTELGVWGVPAVLIPYPGANDHQKYNARVLERLGLASIIEEKSLRGDILRDKIFSELQCCSRALRIKNQERTRGELVSDGASRLCDALLHVSGEKGKYGHGQGMK